MKHFDYLRSQCGTVELVNVEMTNSRLLCGWAYIEAWAQEAISFCDDRFQPVCTINLPLQFQNLPHAIAIGSQEDDLFFAIKHSHQP